MSGRHLPWAELEGVGKIRPGDSLVILADSSAAACQWVVKVVKTSRRSSPDEGIVLRVAWYYRAEEVAGGRQPWHGEQELFRSDHQDCVPIESVMHRVNVRSLGEHLQLQVAGEALDEDDYWHRFLFKAIEPTWLTTRRRPAILPRAANAALPSLRRLVPPGLPVSRCPGGLCGCAHRALDLRGLCSRPGKRAGLSAAPCKAALLMMPPSFVAAATTHLHPTRSLAPFALAVQRARLDHGHRLARSTQPPARSSTHHHHTSSER